MRLLLLSLLSLTSIGLAQSPNHIQPGNSPFAAAVWAGNTLYISGQIATPASGDTKAQALIVFSKIQTILKDQGLGMGDVVSMRVFLVGDPANGGKMDFAAMNAVFSQFFGTKDQPNKPARTAMQVAALAAPGALIEVDAMAWKPGK
jgi:enamine deaminase RidA (YjgF/YER057c/UK114 family)